MTDHTLSHATVEEIEQSLAHALIFDGRRQFRASGQAMARITAQHLVQCLTRAGFVIMRKPPAPAHSSTDFGLRTPHGDAGPGEMAE